MKYLLILLMVLCWGCGEKPDPNIPLESLKISVRANGLNDTTYVILKYMKLSDNGVRYIYRWDNFYDEFDEYGGWNCFNSLEKAKAKLDELKRERIRREKAKQIREINSIY
jgi:hypothetical protein